MSNSYTYTLRLKDQMSGAFSKAAKASGSFFNRFASNAKKMKANLDRLPGSIGRLESKLASLKQKQSNSFSVRQISKYNLEIRKTERQLQKLKNLPPSSFFNRIKTGGGLLKSFAAGFGAFFILSKGVDLAKDSLKAYDVQAKAEAQVNATLRATNLAAGRSFEQLSKQASELQGKTLFGDEATLQIQNMMLTFKNVRTEMFDKSIPAIQDMATSMKIDGKSAAIQLGKALNDPARNLSALSRNGIQFTETQERQIRHFQQTNELAKAQAIILGEVNSQFGGSAQAAADSGMGKWQQFLNRVGDIKEKIGEKLMGLVGIFAHYGNIALDKLRGVWSALKQIPKIVEENQLKFTILLAILGGMAGAIMMIKTIAFVTKIWSGVQMILNVIMTANPLGIIIMAIGALIGIIIAVAAKTDGWGKTFKAVGQLMKTGAIMMWDRLKFSFKNIGFGIKLLGLKFKKFGQWLKGFFQNVGKAVKLAFKGDFAGAKKAFTAPIKTEADEQIARVKAEREALKNEHKKRMAEHALNVAKARSQMGIKWKKGGPGIMDSLKNFGKQPAQPNTELDPTKITETKTPKFSSGIGGGSVKGKDKAESVATGGKKTRIFNITINKVVEQITNEITEGKEQADDLVDEILDQLTRRLHGTVQTLDT